MAETLSPLTARRILIALDTAAECEALLDSVAQLAEHMRAELDALFIEDVDLLHLAGLPFAREVGRFAAPRQLDAAAMERRLQEYASEVQRSLQRAAQRARVQWSFQVVRGRMIAQLLAAAGDTDMLIVARQASLPVQAFRQPSLFAERGPVLVAFAGANGDERALTAAADLASAEGRALVVLLVGADEAALGARRRRMRELLAGRRLIVRERRAADVEVAALVRAAREENAGRVVYPWASLAEAQASLERLSAQLPCPLLIVR